MMGVKGHDLPSAAGIRIGGILGSGQSQRKTTGRSETRTQDGSLLPATCGVAGGGRLLIVEGPTHVMKHPVINCRTCLT